MKKLKCWEFYNCGREGGGSQAHVLDICPAYPDHGHNCAAVEGTFCDLVQGMTSSGYKGCEHCEFYNSEHYDK